MPVMSVTVSIHAPRVGGDAHGQTVSRGGVAFQSTPPAWGATNASIISLVMACGFNPRPPRGGRRHASGRLSRADGFNPRPPRGGRRAQHWQLQKRTTSFNPRPPRGGRPFLGHVDVRLCLFQSTPPAWGATSSGLMLGLSSRLFQSTPPAWGATVRAHLYHA